MRRTFLVAIWGLASTLSAGLSEFAVLAKSPAIYPEWAKDYEVSVTVAVLVQVGDDGAVRTARLKRIWGVKDFSLGADVSEQRVQTFQESALAAARTWKFESPSNQRIRSVEITFYFRNGKVTDDVPGAFEVVRENGTQVT